uniref:Myb-like domain-containing protein n=1 Tax=Anopheles marajoara TaxID=58244 RepID=A0A2M4BCT1_9DIPT
MKQSAVSKKIDLTRVCYQVAKHLLPNHSYQRVTRLVRSKKYGSVDNPITFYLTYGYAPPFNHTLEVMDFDNIIPLAMYQKGILHANWDRYLHSVERARRVLTYVAESGSAVQQPVRGGASAAESTEPPSGVQFKVDVLLPGGVVEVFKTREETPPQPPTIPPPAIIPVSYTVAATARTSATLQNLSSASCIASDHDVSHLPDSASTTSYRINLSSSSNDSTQAELNCDNAPNSTQQQSHASSVSPRRRWAKVGGKENGAPRSRAVANAILYGVLSRYTKLLKAECTPALGSRCKEVKSLVGPIRKVYGHFKLLEVYGRFLGDLRKMSKNLTAYRHRYKALQQFRSLQQDGFWQFSYNSLDGSLIVSARRVASCLVEDRYGMDDKDAVFAFNYYEKVEDVLLAAGRGDLLERFEELIKGFNECEGQATVLYRQIEELLSEEFPDLVDMFLTFLLPGQAVAVGKFMEHFILTNMNDFLEKLNIFFAKQPAQIRKIHTCLNELSNEPNVTMEQVKHRILPLLKGSTLLSEWFLQLFPTEAAPDVAAGDYETITTKRNPPVDGGDGDGIIYEHVPYVETGPEQPESVVTGSGASNTIRYIQGRIIYGALPVRLSFLATNCVAPIGANGESAKDLQLCDDATLRAHAIRLNPLAHSTKHNSMVASTAATAAENSGADINGGSSMASARDAHTTGTIGRHHDDEGSPKKASPKLPIKKRFVSPVAAGRLTPTNGSDRTPPPSAQGAAAKKTVNGHTPTAPTPDSKALSTSKKLRTLINAPHAALAETTSANREPETADPVPLSLDVTDGSVECVSISSTTDDTEESASVSANEEEPSDDPPSFRNGETEHTTATAAVVTPVPEVTSWTREEDKIILEEMKNGYSTVESFVQTIASKLTERSGEQIRNRFEFLLEVLLKVNQK